MTIEKGDARADLDIKRNNLARDLYSLKCIYSKYITLHYSDLTARNARLDPRLGDFFFMICACYTYLSLVCFSIHSVFRTLCSCGTPVEMELCQFVCHVLMFYLLLLLLEKKKNSKLTSYLIFKCETFKMYKSPCKMIVK